MISAWAGTSRSTVSHLTSSTGCLAEEAGDEEFFDFGRGGDDGGEGGGGVGADGDGDFETVVGGVEVGEGDVGGGAGGFGHGLDAG